MMKFINLTIVNYGFYTMFPTMNVDGAVFQVIFLPNKHKTLANDEAVMAEAFSIVLHCKSRSNITKNEDSH